MAFVVNQVNPKSGRFDEHKVMLGFINLDDAKAGYLANYEKGWRGMGEVTPLTINQFKEWLDKGNQNKPAPDFVQKKAQTPESSNAKNRKRPFFLGTIRCDDSVASKPWVYVEVDQGIADSALKALQDEGIDIEKSPHGAHITVLRNDEAKEMIEKYGKSRWKTRCGNGTKVRFSLSNAMVNLSPKGWKDVTKVWFLEVHSQQLQGYRMALGLPPKPLNEKGKGTFEFHITVGIRRKDSEAKKAYVALVGRTECSFENFFAKEAAVSSQGEQLRAVIEKMELDPLTTTQTLGQPFRNAGTDMLMRATGKLIGINKGDEKADDRDSLAFQTFHSPEDFFAERVVKDAGMLGRKALWKSTMRGNVQHIASGALSPQMRGVLLNSGLGAPLEEINPLEIYDQQVRVTRLGEGGISSLDAIPDEARNVQPSHFGFIDPIRSPESAKIGIDSRITHRSYKGDDGQLYSDMIDPRTGQKMRVPAQVATQSTVAFPGEMARKGKTVRAMVNGRHIRHVDKKDVQYELPHATHMFTPTANLVPLVSGIKGGRLLMGAKMATQALPLQNAETPLVQAESDEAGRSFEELYGGKVGAMHARGEGTVTQVTKDHVAIRYADGTKEKHELYDHFPFNRKSYIHSTPSVAVGDKVSEGSLIAKSNFTNNEGSLALGTNLRTAYMPYRGLNYEDGIVISESAAKKLNSEHMYPVSFDQEKGHDVGRNSFVSMFPGKFNKKQIATIADNGVVKPGTVVNHGDPLVLALRKRKPGMVRSKKRTPYADDAVTWGHEAPGVVTDVSRSRNGHKVLVKAYAPMQVGDKMANRYGAKGVISKIIPDAQMPHSGDGKPFEILLNSQGIISRGNPAQAVETMMGKLARHQGRPIKMPGFIDEDYIDVAKKRLQDAGLSATEDLFDPERGGRKVPEILTGDQFFMKLSHMAEGKLSGRDVGSYTAEGLPAKGGEEGAKRVGLLEMGALLSHGATNVIRDAKMIRGQRNDDFWRAFRLGYAPPSPKTPMVYDKMLAHLSGAGINLKKKGDTTHLFAMTDKDVEERSRGALNSADSVTGEDMQVIPGGLFDQGLTGGHGGNQWSHIQLSEPMPNPVMEEPIRRMLGLTQRKYEDVLSGKIPLNGKRGGEAIRDALSRLKLDDEIARAKGTIKNGPRTQRDNAAKVLGYMETLKRAGTKPEELVLTKVPVIPPNFRPVSTVKNMSMVADANFLYRDLFEADRDLSDLSGKLDPSDLTDERLRVYNSFKALSGLGDPVSAKLQEKGVKGLLKSVFGSSPKVGMFQRRVLGSAVDLVGRGAITPNPSLNMDQVGMPESKAWVLYRPFIMRHLIRRGMGAQAAAQAVANKADVARKALDTAMSDRPVIITRAPTLHRFGAIAAWPILTKGKTLQVSPVVTPGLGADFDGDAMNFHVPVSSGAVKDAVEKMMPSRNLRDVANFDVHMLPQQEFLMGLHLASTAKSKKQPRVFALQSDVIKAYNRGEIDLGDPVIVREKGDR
jgi:DNA-directed RNA polymerase beta subunit